MSRKTLPATVRITDGIEVHLANFQAATYVQATQDAGADGVTDGIEISMRILCMIGKIGDRKLTMDDLDEMYQSDIMNLMAYIVAEAEVVDVRNGIKTGTLPSGKKFSARMPKGVDTRAAGKQFGEKNRLYTLIAITTTIDENQIAMHDVQLMDGADFIALTTLLNSAPN